MGVGSFFRGEKEPTPIPSPTEQPVLPLCAPAVIGSILCPLDDMTPNPPAPGTPTHCVRLAERPTANTILAPILGESTSEAADFPTWGTSLRVHR